MKIETCLALFQVKDQLNEIIKASTEDWHPSAETTTSITNNNIEKFIRNNHDLIFENRLVLRDQIMTLAERVVKEYPQDYLPIVSSLHKALGILPNDVIKTILDSTSDFKSTDKTKMLSRGSRVSRNFAALSAKAQAKVINENNGKIALELGVENKQEVLKIIKSCGQYLTHLNLNANTDPSLFARPDFTPEDLAELLRHCPNLREINLNGLSVIEGSWKLINEMKNLKVIKLEDIQTRIPEITSTSLESLNIKGFIVTFPRSLPDQLKHLQLINIQPDYFILPAKLPSKLESLITRGMNFDDETPVVLPNTLKKLSSDCIREQNMPSRWPQNLEDLTLLKLNGTALPTLPKSLKTLELYSCDELNELPKLPNLITLKIVHCEQINTINQVPDSLENLTFRNSDHPVTIPFEILLNIKKLDIGKTNTSVREIVQHSPHLVSFSIRDATATELDLDLRDLSENVRELTIDMQNVEQFEYPTSPTLQKLKLCLGWNEDFHLNNPPQVLAKNLKELTLNITIKGLPEFPKTLEKIDLAATALEFIAVRNLSHLNYLNAGGGSFKGLYIRNCPNLNFNTISGKNQQIQFIVINNTSLRVFEKVSPEWRAVTHVDLSGCENLSLIKDVKDTGITTLKLAGCSNLREINLVPIRLETIDIDGCSKVKKMTLEYRRELRVIEGEFSEGLQELNLQGCMKLEIAPSFLPKSLVRLDLTDVPYHHIWSNEYLNQLKERNPKLEIIGMREPSEVDKNALVLESVRVKESDKTVSLDFGGNVNLRTIAGQFPENLEELSLKGCRRLISAPLILPQSLKSLDLTDVNYQQFWPIEYLEQLQRQNPQLVIIGL